MLCSNSPQKVGAFSVSILTKNRSIFPTICQFVATSEGSQKNEVAGTALMLPGHNYRAYFGVLWGRIGGFVLSLLPVSLRSPQPFIRGMQTHAIGGFRKRAYGLMLWQC